MRTAGERAWRAAWDVAVGAAVAVLVFAAVPGVLAGLVGVPLPAHWSHQDVVSLHGLFDLLAVAAWAAWAACAWPLLRSVVTRVRARDATAGGRSAAPRFGDRLALRIAVAVLAVAPVATAGAATAGAATMATAAATVASPAPFVSRQESRAVATIVGTAAAATEVGARRAAHVRTVAVRRGDSLPRLAERFYDDPGAWPALASLNLGSVMADGERFVDPNCVRPGWTLVVADLDVARGHAGEAGTDGRRPAEPPSPSAPGVPAGLVLPELAILGTGALVAALLARRSRQARRLRSFLREEGAPTPVPSADTADLGRALGSFEHVPVVEMIELAARMLAFSASAMRDAGVALPAPRLVRAGADGVEVRFAEAAPPAPAPWVPAGDHAWLLPAAAEEGILRRASRDSRPWVPILLPVGEDERGSWLLPLAAGESVSVIGAASGELLHAMVAGVRSWTWPEDVVVTGDANEAAAVTAPAGHHPEAAACPRVLFTGDPRALPLAARRECAVLTAGPVDTADLSVIVDRRAATVHPLGLTVRPHLLDPAWSGAIAELAASDGDGSGDGAEASPGPDPGSGDGPRPGPPRGSSPITPSFREPRTGTATVRVRPEPPPEPRMPLGAAPGPAGTVEVRMLVPVPSVEGLPEALPPKRTRRATELIAYLAVHAPTPVTGDRLRTRVLGTADADAAAKTLFNTAGAARRALGAGPDGQPLLPAATRTGQYRLSASVTVDARRCVELLAAGRAAADPAGRSALLQRGLSLVGGEPLSGVLAGYGWWRAEGHERRVDDAVVDGTGALVRLAVQTRQVDLGRWALERARLVEPYSEALTRAAMALAAASGDARRLQLEWEECRRQVDELDPGGAPSEPTERLYRRLRQELRGGSLTGEPTAVLHA